MGSGGGTFLRDVRESFKYDLVRGLFEEAWDNISDMRVMRKSIGVIIAEISSSSKVTEEVMVEDRVNE